MCVTIERENPNSRGSVELEGLRFKCTFIAYEAFLNGFILGYCKMLCVDALYLSGLYEGTLLAVVVLDADNHLFDVAYVVVSPKKNNDWYGFLFVLQIFNTNTTAANLRSWVR